VAFPQLVAMADGVILNVLGGDSVRYSPRVQGVSVTVPGLFEAKHQRTDVLDVAVTAAVPAVFVRAEALAPNDPETDEDPKVTVNGTTYKVRETRKDGLGGVWMLLTEMSA